MSTEEDTELDASALESIPPSAPDLPVMSAPPPVPVSRAPKVPPRPPVVVGPGTPAAKRPNVKPAELELPSVVVALSEPPPAFVPPAPPSSESILPVVPPPWTEQIARITREIDAQAQQPTHAALLLAARARIEAHGLHDREAALATVQQALKLAPEARFVRAAARALAEQGNEPAAVLSKVRAELASVGEGRERAALLWQAAGIEEHVSTDVPAAMRTMREVLALDPNDIGAVDVLGALHLRSRANPQDETVFGPHIDAIDRLAQATEDAVIKSALHGAVGALRDRYLGTTAEAAALASLRRALESDSGNADAQSSLEAILLRRRAWDEYARVITALAERTSDPLAAREYFERGGDVFADCLDDHEHASACYLRAATLAETEPGPVEKLARMFEIAGRWDDALRAYEQLINRLRDPSARAWTLVRVGGILETRLERIDEAISAYKLAVETAPTFAPALQALLRLVREQSLDLTIELERREANRIVDPSVRAVRYAALAEMVAQRTDLASAAPFYERTLSLDATNASAFEALDRTYRASGQWTELIALYEMALAAAQHARRIRSLRLDLAELVHSRANNPQRAAELRKQALTGPDDRYHTLVGLGRALTDAGDYAALASVLEQQTKLLDGTEQVAALHHLGVIYETRVGDLTSALATYEKVLELSPRHEAAARALSRIHQQEGRWERVIEAERKILDLTTRPEDVLDGLIRIARISEEHLGRGEGAIGAYLEALYIAPTHESVIAALERLLKAAADHRRLVQVLERYASASTDVHVRARARLRAATVLELQLGDTENAAKVIGQALEDIGDEAYLHRDADLHAALWGLYRLQETRGEWQAVEATLARILKNTTDSLARKRVLVRLARNAELRLDSVPRAARLYEEVLATSAKPDSYTSEAEAAPKRDRIAALIAARSVDRLRIARLQGKRELIAASVAAMAACTTDVRLESGLLRVLAIATEHFGAPEKAAALYEKLSSRDAADTHALDGLVRSTAALVEQEGDLRLSRALLARARATTDAPLRAILGFAAGVIDESAGRSSKAEKAYTLAFEADPELLPALDGLRRLRTRSNEWSSVASIAERAAGASSDPHNAAESWREAAEVYENRLGDPMRALTSYQALLLVRPEDVSAVERSLDLLERAGDFVGASNILAAHAEALRKDPAAQARTLIRRAKILSSKLNNVTSAIADLRRALILKKDDDVAVLEELASLEERAQHWQEALALYERIPSAEPDAHRRAQLARARVHSQELRDDAKAITILEALVHASPDDRDAAFQLADLSARSGNDRRALELYAALATGNGSAPERLRALVAQSDVEFGQPKGDGSATLARAFDLTIADPTLIPSLREIVVARAPIQPTPAKAARMRELDEKSAGTDRTRGARAFIRLAEEAIGRAPPSTPGILPLRVEMARVLRADLTDPDAADRQLTLAIERFPESMETRLSLAHALLGRDDDAALTELRKAIAFDPFSADCFAALVGLTRRRGQNSVATLLASAASLLGSTSSEVDNVLASLKAPRPAPASLPFDEALGQLVGKTRAPLVRSILAIVDPFLHKVFPDADDLLDSRPRLPATSPVVASTQAISAALGTNAPALHRGISNEVLLLLTENRSVVVGRDLDDALAAFQVACVCARIAAHGSLFAAPRQDMMTLLEACVIDDPVKKEHKKMRGSLPRKAKKDLEALMKSVGTSFDLQAEVTAWDGEEARRALYGAIVLCRDLRAVAQVLTPDALALPRVDARRKALANQRLREVLEFVSSSTCWDVVQRIYG